MQSDPKTSVPAERPLSRKERRARERGKNPASSSGSSSRDDRAPARTRDDHRPGGNYHHRGNR